MTELCFGSLGTPVEARFCWQEAERSLAQTFAERGLREVEKSPMEAGAGDRWEDWLVNGLGHDLYAHNVVRDS